MSQQITDQEDNGVDVMTKKPDCKWRPDAEYKYFVRDPINDGMLYYRSEALRDEAAAEVIESYLDEHWDEEVENVITGTVTGISTKYNVSEPVGELDDEGLDGAGEYWPEGVSNQSLTPRKLLSTLSKQSE